MPRSVCAEMLQSIYKVEGVYKVSTKTKLGDLNIDILDWFLDGGKEIPLERRGFLGIFRKRILRLPMIALDQCFRSKHPTFQNSVRSFILKQMHQQQAFTSKRHPACWIYLLRYSRKSRKRKDGMER